MPTPYEEKMAGRNEFKHSRFVAGKRLRSSYEKKMSGRKSARDRKKKESDDFQKEYIKYLTELPYDKVEGTGIENDWHDVQASLHGSVRKDPRNLVQRKADELY